MSRVKVFFAVLFCAAGILAFAPAEAELSAEGTCIYGAERSKEGECFGATTRLCEGPPECKPSIQ